MERNGQHPSASAPSTSAQSAPAIVRQEGPLATGERFRPFALAALTVALIALCVYLTVPFLPAVTWGVALAVIAWPFHTWLLRRVTENRTGAAALASLVVVLALVVPGVFVTRQLAREAATTTDHINTERAKTTLRDRLANTPGMEGAVAWIDRTGVDLEAEARTVLRSYFGAPAALAQGSVVVAIQAAIALFILFYMLRDRNELLAGVRRLLPMRRAEAERVFDRAAGSVYANLYATLITSVIDGVGLGLMFWLVGLPSPVTWGVVTFVLSFLPILGTYLVWMPAAIYLGVIGNWGGAGAIMAYGILSWIVVDNFVYVRIAGDRMHLHQVPTLLAFLGGLAVFGASGMILGPGILAVTVAVLEVWHNRATEEGTAGAEARKPAAAGEPEPAVPVVAPAH